MTVHAATNSTEAYKFSDNFTEVNGLLFFTAELMNDVDGLFYYDPAVVTSANIPVMEEASFSIYPNPSSSYLNLKLKKPVKLLF